MLRNIFNLSVLAKQLDTLKPFMRSNGQLVGETLTKTCLLCIGQKSNSSLKSFHTSLPRTKMDDRRILIASMPKKEDGTSGENAINIDSLIQSRDDMFPNEDTPKMLFNNVPFAEVPIVNIRVSRNNTILTLSDGTNGKVKLIRSCGIEGFKNTRKGTNIAAQATAITFTEQVLKRGCKTVRVRVKGLGPGRLSAIKGLQMGGLNIISVTDNTLVSWNPPRPRKQRTL